jgi:hypothetical protein
MKLIDHLHYYLGCDYWTNNSQGNLNAKTLPDVIDMVKRGMDVRLHLRRLEDMTEEEALTLAKIYSGSDKIKRTTGTVNNFFYFFCEFKFGEKGVCETLIMHKGEAWYQHYFDKRPKRGRGHNIVNQFEGAHYLLCQHFDLFNLIDNGLALDAKTITP